MTEREEPPLVELRGVRLSLGGRPVLRGVDLSVRRGERLVILGRSGGGKSTLLRVILGIVQPGEGSVFFEGRPLSHLSRARLNAVRRRIGMVYQSGALISSLSVRGNLALPLEELSRKRRAAIDRIAAEKLALVGMEGTGSLLPAELSGGMRKRVAIARALMLEPELLLFDEPTAGLDPVIARVIDRLIIGSSRGAACVVVTHELENAFRVATRMAMLEEGRIVETAPPGVFRQSRHPAVVEFLNGGEPAPAP